MGIQFRVQRECFGASSRGYANSFAEYWELKYTTQYFGSKWLAKIGIYRITDAEYTANV